MRYRLSLKRAMNNGAIRYYKIELFATLFGEYVIEREYGSVKNKAPTGVKKNYLHSFLEAKILYDSIVKSKKQRGYA